MQIDTDHLHYWMQAIRQSPNPVRVLDAFWAGQIKSKEWLIENLQQEICDPVTIDIHGGWVGVLSSLLFQSGIPITKITSIDIDPACEPVAIMMNKLEEMQGRFEAAIADMCVYKGQGDVVINTCCEHLTQAQYDQWLEHVNPNSLVVLQSNNYYIAEHVRPAESLQSFMDQSNIIPYRLGELPTELYNRYMIIGKKP